MYNEYYYHNADNSYPGPSSLSIDAYYVKIFLSSSNLSVLFLQYLYKMIAAADSKTIINIIIKKRAKIIRLAFESKATSSTTN